MKRAHHQKVSFLIVAISLLLVNNIYPQVKDTVAVIEKKAPALVFSAYFDFNYFKNLNNPRSGSNTGLSGAARAFDQKENQFQLGMVQSKVTYSRAKSDVVLDLTFGPHADLGNYGNLVGPLGKGTTALAIKQAYFNYKVTKKLTFTAGQWGTHVGFEWLDAPLNYHYSLCNLFNNGPFYHTGISANYTFNQKVKLLAGLVNNWDNLYDNNKFKTAIAQLNINPNDKMVIFLNYVGGDESTTSRQNSIDSLHNFKQLLDLAITWSVTSKFFVGINAVAGAASGLEASQSDTTKLTKVIHNWGGVAFYTSYQFSKVFGFGIRADFFDNTAGVMYIGKTDVKSLTATARFSLDDDHLFIKPEFRMDVYKKLNYTGPDAGNIQQFEDARGYYTKNSQITIGIAFIYKF